jgi:hypothetical protein
VLLYHVQGIADDSEQTGRMKIIAVERERKDPIPGRYTVQFPDGRVVNNYPGYLIKDELDQIKWFRRPTRPKPPAKPAQ